MALYAYIKTPVKSKTISWPFNWLPLVLISVGLVMMANAVWPIVYYQLKSLQFQTSANYVDYNNPQQWFNSAPVLAKKDSRVTEYHLSIPKLKIDQAKVTIGGEDLSESLIQYPGTALPGQYGNVIIFGHSILPQFYNPKVYKTIFSTLPDLKKGDEILVDFDGVLYRYQIFQLVQVSPDDVSVLEQRYDAEYLSLITCVPPGTYLHRLIVQAKLINPQTR